LGITHDLGCPETRVAGLKQVLRYARQSAVEKVYIAKDADEDIIVQLKQICAQHRVPYDISHTMHQIGSACQLDVGSACAAVCKVRR